MSFEIKNESLSSGENPQAPPIRADSDESFLAEVRLRTEIEDALQGRERPLGADRNVLLPLCRAIDFWLAEDNLSKIRDLGLLKLAQEVKKDYVLASFLAWRAEYKLSYIALRSFLESFCLLLYYLNQGCDRTLYLKGKGYKLMLHRMVQKRDPEDTHAFRRHYHLLISDSSSDAKMADKFFDEINTCYSLLSKAVHGDYSPKPDETLESSFLELLHRCLRICNTLALHEPALDATEDELEKVLESVLKPIIFEPASR